MPAATNSPVEYETTAGRLPAQVLAVGALPKAEEIEEGQIIAFHSRGRYRAAKVTKATPKRVTAQYTTEGAHADGEKIAAIDCVGRIRAEHRRGLSLAVEYRAKAAAIEAGEVDPAERQSGCVLAFLKDEADRAERIQIWRDEYPAQLREWAARAEDSEKFKERLAKAEAQDAIPFAQRVVEATHVTTKNVKRDEVFALDVEAGA